MNTSYLDLLAQKTFVVADNGLTVESGDIHPALFPFQQALVKWATRKGRAALFVDTGLGKTVMQTEWARLIGGRSLIVAPLSVARQTVKMARLLTGTDVHYTRDGGDLADGINITNYEMLNRFDPDDFRAVVLDESSILKAIDGKTRARMTDMFADTPYKLACTATPAPNDIAEIGNHAEFLGVMSRADMLASFFVHDEQEWRLKGHAQEAFYRWLASWAMSVRKPSDIGYEDTGYDLPPLSVAPVWFDADLKTEGAFFFMGLHGVQDRTRVRAAVMDERLARVAEMVNANNEPWIVWHGLNGEGQALERLIPGSVLVEGSQSAEHKAAAIEAFQDGSHRVLITKPRIAGFGMNFQHCAHQVFAGLSDSWEMFYQCIRRSYRFGQDRPVNVYAVLAEAEREIWDNVMHKEREAQTMAARLIDHVRAFEQDELDDGTHEDSYHPTIDMVLPAWLRAA